MLESPSAQAREWNKKNLWQEVTRKCSLPPAPPTANHQKAGGLTTCWGAKEESESPESATRPPPAEDLGRGRPCPSPPDPRAPGEKGQLRSSCAQRKVQPARAASRGPGIRTATSAAILEASRPQAEPLRGSPAPGAPNPGTCAPVSPLQRAKPPRAGRVRPLPPGSTSPVSAARVPTLRERFPVVPGPPPVPLPPGPVSRA